MSKIWKEKNTFYDKRIKPLNTHNPPKLWWKQIKKVVGSKRDSISIIDPETGNPLNAEQSAKYINTFFADLSKNYPEVSDEWLTITADEPLPQISMANVIKKLKGIDANKAYGPFDPSIKIIKLFADCFAVRLLHIFNQSFQTMKFPEVWKTSNVCTIPKTTPCNRVEELRPISLTSVLSKVQESYAIEWILEDVQEEISVSQFGGLAGSSAVLALVYLVHNWYKNMDSTGKVVRVSLLDFRKTYDLINHNKLLENFMNIGVRPS